MGIETLRLLREHGLIQGFSLVTSHKRKLYPRATVYLKFAHRYSPIISDIRLFKNTARNFTTVRYLKKRGIYNPRKFYLITNVRGLELVSLSTLLQNNTVYGRVLAEFSV
jgi:ribosomal protein S8